MVSLYAGLESAAGKRLHKMTKSLLPAEKIRVFRTVDELSRGLHQPGVRPNILILLADNRKALSECLSLNDLLWDLRIILVLPDRDSETVSKGCTLYPRYLTYADSDFMDVASVLEKMLNLDVLKKAV